MEIKKLIFGLSTGIILSGCVQSTAMIGPAITIASTGNISQAGFTFITNKAVEEETGMQTHELIVKKVEEQKLKTKDKKINKELSVMLENNIRNKQLIILLERNIKKTRNILNSD